MTVPALLSQIEGILVDAAITLEEVEPNDRINYKKQKDILSNVILKEEVLFHSIGRYKLWNKGEIIKNNIDI